MQASRQLPNSVSVINQCLTIGDKQVKLKDMAQAPKEAFEKSDTLTKLFILENEFTLAKQMQMPYPRSWSEINRLLNENYSQGDFNALDPGKEGRYISCMGDLRKAFRSAHKAYENLDTDWYVYHCSCGKEIRLSYRQVRWYKNKRLPVPTLCDECMAALLGEEQEI